ncbi:hypothetical protein [Acinetobacter johnsonii]|uniref:hypothetical protein n=1 Tax=Acinetobacter johnsonii TaxID=40214 RepID=UPI0020915EF0|nr:hypothetical protein [Acinetobacter johnsonii]
MNNQNLAQDLTKKKPEARLSDFLVQKHSSGIEHVSESSTANMQKKARELRSGFSIQFRGYTFMNDANLPQQVIEDNIDFLIGDAVVLDKALGNFDGIYEITEVYENNVDVYIGIGILTLNKRFVRSASTTELNAKRRLTEAEQALAEVP